VIEKEIEYLKKELKEFEPKIKNKTFLVTGGAGFLGSWVCDVLVAMQAKVICVDNISCGKKENIEHLLDKDNFVFLKEDVSKTDFLDLPEVKDAKIDFVFHLAARADPQDYMKYPIETMMADSFGTYNTLELAEKNKALFYFSSTSEVYGDPLEHPQKEEHWGNVNPIGVRSCYDESKRFSEALIMNYFREKGLEVRINRIFNTYGPRLQDGRALPTFINQSKKDEPITVFGDGSQTRSLCYVTDTLTGIFKTIFLGESGEIYNLGNPKEMTILELAEKTRELMKSDSEIVFKGLPKDDPVRRFPYIEKARKKIGYSPKISLEDGVQRTIDWHNSLA